MEHPSSESTDDEVLVLLREGKPLKELLEELISLRFEHHYNADHYHETNEMWDRHHVLH